MSLCIPTWLNAEFVQKVLRNSAKDDSINVHNISTKPATQTGDNYLSDMIRVNVVYSCNASGCEMREEKALIVKIAPTVAGPNHDLVIEMRAFETEIRMMEDTLVKMSTILDEGDCRLSAGVLYSEIGDPSFLVIDDLAPAGYRMADRQSGLDLQHCLLAMRGLAKFHASSVALCEKEPQQKLLYPRGRYNKRNPETLKKFYNDGIRKVASEVANWPELGSSASIYSEKLFKLSEVSYDRATEYFEPKDNEFCVINHGDFWVNNMLFRYDEDGNVIGHIFVDFQVCVWSSPAYDILNFLSTSATHDVYTHHRPALVEEYLNHLTKTMDRLGCETKPPSLAELQKTLEDNEYLSILSSSVGLAFILVDKDDAKSIDDIINETDGYSNPAYKGQTYRKMMIGRLHAWNDQGLLDL